MHSKVAACRSLAWIDSFLLSLGSLGRANTTQESCHSFLPSFLVDNLRVPIHSVVPEEANPCGIEAAWLMGRRVKTGTY